MWKHFAGMIVAAIVAAGVQAQDNPDDLVNQGKAEEVSEPKSPQLGQGLSSLCAIESVT